MILDNIDNRFLYVSYIQENNLNTDILIYAENTIKKFDTI